MSNLMINDLLKIFTAIFVIATIVFSIWTVLTTPKFLSDEVMKLKIQCDDFTSKHGDLTLNNILAEELIMNMDCLELQELIQAIEKAKGKQYIIDILESDKCAA